MSKPIGQTILVWLSLAMAGASQSTTSAAVFGGGSGGPPAAYYQCFEEFIAMQAGLPNDTSNAVSLCAVSGSLWNAMSTAQACIGQTVQAIPQASNIPNFTHLNSVLAECNSFVTSSYQSSCSSLSAKSESCVISTSVFGQAALASATSAISSSAAVSPAATTSAAQPSSTGSQAQSENNKSGSNIGLVAGVAVGAALAALIIACAVAFFIWRWRRQARAKGRNVDTPSSGFEDDAAEKAQRSGKGPKLGVTPERMELGSDLSSERKELPSPPSYARNVGTLQELDSNTMKRQSCIKELASNEEVASEMATTDPSSGTKSAVSTV